MEEMFKNKILDDLYELRGEELEYYYIQKYGEPEERKKLYLAEKELLDFINRNVKDNKIFKILNDYQARIANENGFWNGQYYKLGFIDCINFRKELKDDNIVKNTDETEALFAGNNPELSYYIENMAIRKVRATKQYKDNIKRIAEIKEKYPKVMKYIENREIEDFTKEELKGILEIIELNEGIGEIEKQASFRLGFKNGMMIWKK